MVTGQGEDSPDIGQVISGKIFSGVAHSDVSTQGISSGGCLTMDGVFGDEKGGRCHQKAGGNLWFTESLKVRQEATNEKEVICASLHREA